MEDACVPLPIWVQHIPRARQHQVTYAGHFANALGHLNPKQESQVEESAEKPNSGKWVKWRTLVLRSWAVDPELCPRCQKEMKRAGAWNQAPQPWFSNTN